MGQEFSYCGEGKRVSIVGCQLLAVAISIESRSTASSELAGIVSTIYTLAQLFTMFFCEDL